MTSADHADDLVPISVSHRLQRFFDEGILVGQRANETCVQYCIRDPSDPLLMHLIICTLEVMEWNLSYSRCVATSLSGSCHFSKRSKISRGDLHLFSMDLSTEELHL